MVIYEYQPYAFWDTIPLVVPVVGVAESGVNELNTRSTRYELQSFLEVSGKLL